MVVVPGASASQAPPSNKDTTTLGQAVAHIPTSLAPKPLYGKPESKGTPAANTSKTTVGQVVSHVPTSIAKGPSRASPRPAPAGRTSQTTVAKPTKSGSRPWIILAFVVLPGMFICSIAFTVGLVHFLNSPKASRVAELPVVQLAEKKSDPQKPEQPQKKHPIGDESGAAPFVAEKTPLATPQEKSPVAKKDDGLPNLGAPKEKNADSEELPIAEPPAPPIKVAEEKQPDPAPKPLPPKANGDIPADVKALIGKLRDGSDEEKVAAAAALSDRGVKAHGVARALCQLAINPKKAVSRSALQALEKVAPDLYEPVFTLIVDGQAGNHRKAVASLRGRGSSAKPAMPVLLFDVRKCLADLPQASDGRSKIGWAPETLLDVINDELTAMPEIASEDLSALATIIDAADFALPRQIRFRTKSGFLTTQSPFRATGVTLLGTVAKKQPDLRKQISSNLASHLDQSVKNLEIHSADPSIKNDPIRLQQALARDLQQITTVGESLLQCGPAAKDIFAKKLVPVLKELEFHDNAKVRFTAKELRKDIEAGSTADPLGVPKTGVLFQGQEKHFSYSMKIGKTYIVVLASSDFDPFLKLKNSVGRIVAQDDPASRGLNAHITFVCPQSGTYDIVASSLGGSGSGNFKLSVREQ